MIKIKKIQIERYRSIVNLKLEINQNNNFVAICGENNTGKTNTIRAIDLFFNPDKYNPKMDIPFHKLEGSRGGATTPKISIDFLLENNDIYRIERQFNLQELAGTKGIKLKLKDIRDKHEEMQAEEVKKFLDKLQLFFIESINISFPDVINNIIEEIYDVEYKNTRFRGSKDELRTSFENYIQGLLDILKQLSSDINPLFQEYKKNWGIDFGIDVDIKQFRDLISNEIVFFINDGSNQHIEGKGSGLQRLAYILLHYRIVEKIKSKSVILLIDEPDVYLHQGLQKQLLKHLKKITNKAQIIITTHSPIFIDYYTLNNVFLLDLEITKQFYKRKKREFSILNTKVVEIDQIDGTKQIRDYLGIEDLDYELLNKYNLIVEGDCDKNYIETLCMFFGFSAPKIIPAHGATRIVQWLDFYESFYKDRQRQPCLLILLDNDNQGREVFLSIDIEKYKNLKLIKEVIPTFQEQPPSEDEIKKGKIKSNLEIEDIIYPKVLCYLVNEILKKRGLACIQSKTIEKKIKQGSFKAQGILALIEHEKNQKNPETGPNLNFVSSQKASTQLKEGMANLFKQNLQGNKKLIKLIEEGNSQYPKVKEFLGRITNPRNFV